MKTMGITQTNLEPASPRDVKNITKSSSNKVKPFYLKEHLKSFKIFLTLILLTEREMLRRSLWFVTTLSTVSFILIAPFTVIFRFSTDNSLVRETILTVQLISGIFLVLYLSSISVRTEIESEITMLILTKPVSRTLFLFSKFMGISFAVIQLCIATGIFVLVSERIDEKLYEVPQHGLCYVTDTLLFYVSSAGIILSLIISAIINYRKGVKFTLAGFKSLVYTGIATIIFSAIFDRTGSFAPFKFYMDFRIIPAIILNFFLIEIIAALSVVLSLIFDIPTVAIAGIASFSPGLIFNLLFSKFPGSIIKNLIYILPNWQILWAVDMLREGGVIPWDYVYNAGLYSLSIIAGIISLGIGILKFYEVK